MRFDIAETAHGVPPAAALQWWSDFREGPTDHRFVPGQRRRILRTEGSEVTMEDVVRPLGVLLFRERTRARILADRVEAAGEHAEDTDARPGYMKWPRVEFDGENTVSRFSGSYVFEPRGNGTRVRLVADVHLRRALAVTRPLAAPIARAILRADLRGHVREMEAALAGGAGAGDRVS